MDIDSLCKKYGFTYEYMANHIKIRSNNDVWYIDDYIDFSKREIILYHENNNNVSVGMFRGYRKSNKNSFNMNNNKIWHRQTNKLMNINEIFKYINKHDQKYSCNKCTKIQYL
jgi:hypothetical protein